MSIVRRLRKHRRRLDRAEPPVAPSAYALLKEARLRCQRLRDTTRQGAECAPLKLIHRDLGIAGYLACSSLASDRPGELLAVVHRQADQSVQTGSASWSRPRCSPSRPSSARSTPPLGCEHPHVAQTHLNHALELRKRHATAGIGPAEQPRPPQTTTITQAPRDNPNTRR